VRCCSEEMTTIKGSAVSLCGNGLVSVIIPAFNAEKYVREAVESVLSQTHPYFEIIVVDDFSDDGTAHEVEKIKDKRIRLIRHQANHGPGEARNTAMAAASGQWLAVLDADDQWLPGRLEALLKLANQAGEGYFVSEGSLVCFDTPAGLKPWANSLKQYHHIPAGPEGTLDLDLGGYFRLGTPMLKPLFPLEHVRVHKLRYDSHCRFGEDLEFYCYLFMTGLKLRLSTDAHYLYRLTPDSLTAQAGKLDSLLTVMQRLSAAGFSDTEQQHFKDSMDWLQREKSYTAFTALLKKRKLRGAAAALLSEPVLLPRFLSRLPRSLRFQLAAQKWGGAPR
jgi:glycosyltransferase involved in cell wall biosynthesis